MQKEEKRVFHVDLNDTSKKDAMKIIKKLKENYKSKKIFEIQLSHGARIPERNNPTDSGLDLRIKGYRWNQKDSLSNAMWFDEETIPHDHSGTVFIRPKERILALTGIKIAIPECDEVGYVYEMQVRPRSGQALKKGLTVLNSPGTIDKNYRGDIGVILINNGDDTIILNDDDKIAQLVIVKVFIGEIFIPVEEFSEDGDRGDSGFGSSDKK